MNTVKNKKKGEIKRYPVLLYCFNFFVGRMIKVSSIFKERDGNDHRVAFGHPAIDFFKRGMRQITS